MAREPIDPAAYLELIGAVARAAAGPGEDPEDLAHDVVLDLLSAPRHADGGRKGEVAYVTRAVHNKARMHGRRAGLFAASRRRVARSIAVESRRDMEIDAREALDRIPPRHADAAEALYCLGFTRPEIAAAAGITVGAVQDRALQARRRLRSLLAAYDPDAAP